MLKRVMHMKNEVLVTQDSNISVIRRAKCRCKCMCRELLDFNPDNSSLQICLEPMGIHQPWDHLKW